MQWIRRIINFFNNNSYLLIILSVALDGFGSR